MTNASKMGRKVEKNKYIRKVTLLKYNDRKDGLIFSRTVTTTREKLTIKVQCKAKVKKTSNKDRNKKKYPIFKVAIKERIVPCCLRPQCSNKNIRTNHQRDSRNRRRCKPKRRSDIGKKLDTSSSLSLIDISDEDDLSIYDPGYENISSDSLSSYTDDEVDTLMESTRKRMKDLDTDWLLLPRTYTCSTLNISKDMSQSTNSLDTLVLDEEPIVYTQEFNIKNETYSPKTGPTKVFYEQMKPNNNDIKLQTFHDFQLDNSSKNNQYLKNNTIIKEEKNTDEPMKSNNNIKFETLNNIKSEHSSKGSQVPYKIINIIKNKFIDTDELLMTDNNHIKLEHGSIHSENVYVNTSIKKEKSIETSEAKEVNNNNVKSDAFNNYSQDLYQSSNNKTEKNFIDAVVTKLENNDMDCLPMTNLSIKREIYCDL